MAFDTVIQGGTIVTADRILEGDVAIEGEKIAEIGEGLARRNGGKIIDARGHYVMPGGIDVHVHLALPFCGTTSSDDYDSGTRAAACGGVTCLIDFALPYGEDTMNQAVNNWMKKAKGKACIDYSFHAAITNWKRHGKEIHRIMERGIPTFKQFMIYEKEGWQSDDGDIYRALDETKKLGGMCLIHAESSKVLDVLIEQHHNRKEMKELGAVLHAITRPNFVEAEAIQRVIKWTEVTGGTMYVVHMSTADGADLIKDARRRGIGIFAETCVQYLTLEDSLFGGEDGHLYATCPQLKKKPDMDRLWKGVKNGEVCVVSTDTCTFTRKQKAMWKGDWTKIPMGMPGLETLLPLVYTKGVLGKKITLNQFVEKCSTNPAKIMGMYPQKGSLEPGADADVIIVHPKTQRTVDWQQMQTNADWSPFQGWSLAGFPVATFSRGKQIVDDYKFVGKNGWGKFVARKNPGQL